MNRIALARVLAVLTIAAGALFHGVAAGLKPGYSAVSQYISELNASGTPWAQEIGWLGFVPLGLLLALFLIAVRPLIRARGAAAMGFALLFSQPLALVSVAFLPCDAGCPLEGSLNQQLHNLVAVVTYVAAGIGMLMLSTGEPAGTGNRLLKLAGLVWLLAFFAMLQPEIAAVRGLVQRAVDALFALVIVLLAWPMAERPAPGRSRAA